ncbi:MAG: hypothetical protein MZV64_63390 [Ignavibacteriales bacterium]|nr:hypothetical protein [Ignavibacteriales bacterium]
MGLDIVELNPARDPCGHHGRGRLRASLLRPRGASSVRAERPKLRCRPRQASPFQWSPGEGRAVVSKGGW